MPAKTDYLSTYMQDHRAGAEMGRDLAVLRETLAPAGDPVPRAQERFTVTESA